MDIDRYKERRIKGEEREEKVKGKRIKGKLDWALKEE